MNLDIDGSSVARRLRVRRHVEGETSRALGPFADRIAIVRVRISELDAHQSGRTLCAIAVTLERHEEGVRPWVLGRCQHDDVFVAIERAAERAAKAVRDELGRRDREAVMRARALIEFSRTGAVEQV